MGGMETTGPKSSHKIMNKLITTFMLALLAACPLAGFGESSLEKAPAYLPIDTVLDLKTIRPTVNVNLPHFLLKDALAGLTNVAEPGANDIADLLKDIKLIRVVVIDHNQNKVAGLDDAMKTLRDELDKKWTAIVSVPGENVGVYVMPDAAGESNAGLAVLVNDHGDAVIVNIVGHIPIDKAMKLASQKDVLKNLKGLGIPSELFGGQSKHTAAAPELKVAPAPKITGASALSADEVLKKALAARGGAEALQKIHSVRAKGNAHFNTPALSCDLPDAEYLAMRPDKWRFTADIKTSAGVDLGRADSGFDGQRGWEDNPGAGFKEIAGRPLEQQKENGLTFAWHDDPAVYKSTQCIGEAAFDGKTCYAVKIVFDSGHEKMHYYDTNNFLFIGSTFTMDSYYGSSPFRYSYGDYKEFNGFKLPTRIGWQSKWSKGEVHYDSMELNSVEESAIQTPAQSTVTASNSNK